MYKNIEELQIEIDMFTPKDIVDYFLNGSQLNRWSKYIKDKTCKSSLTNFSHNNKNDMRYLKFRAFDSDNNRWVYLELINADADCYLLDKDGKKYQDGTDLNKLTLSDWQQFTGLLDKNGKEIYFGDILATSNDNPEYDIWTKEDNGYTVAEESKEELGIDFSLWAIEDEHSESIYSKRFVVIIGNIFENSELLT